MVRTEIPSGLELFSRVEVTIECAGHAMVVEGQVLQVFAGIGVAVGLDDTARKHVAALATGSQPILTSRDAGSAPIELPTEVSARVARGTESEVRRREAAPATPEPRVAQGSSPAIDRIQLALRGDRDDRAAILRDRNRMLHVYVLRNPALSLEEVSAIARMTTVSVDTLKQIAERREWGHRPEIAISLVRNPTVPVPVALDLLDHVSPAELRNLAKDGRTREPIQRAARKRLLA